MKVLAVRHVKVEGLGMLEDAFYERGWSVKYLEISEGEILKKPLEEFSLIVVLGGYMGAYEEDKYPFLKYEFKLVEEALHKNIPLLGICLGSQILARVLGARVYRGKWGEEIGWLEVEKVLRHPYFQGFPSRLTVFQWHGDTFQLPQGATRVFSSKKYENQGFVFQRAVGLQFHLEVGRKVLWEWIREYRNELKEKGIHPEPLLREATKHDEKLRRLIDVFLKDFLTSS